MKKQVTQRAGQIIANNLNIPLHAPNTILESAKDNFYLSYNSSCSGYGCATTALVLKENNHCEVYFVLNGNHIDKMQDLNLINSMAYILDNFNLINEIGKENKEFYIKGLENLKRGDSYFLDNEDKWTLFCKNNPIK